MLQRIFHCNCDCVQTNVYTVLALANLVMMLGSVVGAQSKDVRMRELKYLVLYLIVFVVIFLVLEWLCANNHSMIAWVLALLPFVSALIHGHRMAKSGHIEANNLLRMGLNRFGY
jgi:uncharacterized membrane protein YcaP (DUF421 family)